MTELDFNKEKELTMTLSFSNTFKQDFILLVNKCNGHLFYLKNFLNTKLPYDETLNLVVSRMIGQITDFVYDETHELNYLTEHLSFQNVKEANNFKSMMKYLKGRIEDNTKHFKILADLITNRLYANLPFEGEMDVKAFKQLYDNLFSLKKSYLSLMTFADYGTMVLNEPPRLTK